MISVNIYVFFSEVHVTLSAQYLVKVKQKSTFWGKF